jgi:photosystem II stability/assembly factor-like uncharacterized protein
MKKQTLLLTVFLFLFHNISIILAQWQQTSGPEGGSILDFTFTPTDYGGNNPIPSPQIVLGTTGGIYSGEFYLVNQPFFNFYSMANSFGGSYVYEVKYTPLASVDSIPHLFAATSSGLFIQDNNEWTLCYISPNVKTVRTIAISPFENYQANIYIGTYDYGIFKSTDFGKTWQEFNNGLTNLLVNKICVVENNLYACTQGGLFLFDDLQNSWREIDEGISNKNISSIIKKDNYLFAITRGRGVFRSGDSGLNWTEVNSNLLHSYLYAIMEYKNSIFVAGLKGLYKSNDLGESWIQINTESPAYDFFSLASKDSTIFAGSQVGVLYSNDDGETWNTLNSNLKTSQVTSLQAIPYISSFKMYACTWGGIFTSTDEGNNWIPNNEGLTNFNINCINYSTDFANVFIGTNSGVFKSSLYGDSWQEINNGLTNKTITSLVSYPAPENPDNNYTILFAGTYQGIFKSSNNGLEWNKISSLQVSSFINSYNLNSGLDLLASNGKVILKSINQGENWDTCYIPSSTNTVITCLTTDMPFAGKKNIFAGTSSDGILKSTDDGVSWTELKHDLDGIHINIIQIINNYLLAGTNKGVLISFDYGDSWNNWSEGLINQNIKTFSVIYSKVYTGTLGNSVWVRPLGEITSHTDVNETSSVLKSFLLQNYPNPFNPSTIISYSIPKQSHVTLTVYNNLGQKVSELLNSEQEAGYHQINFDGSILASGVYYYRLSTDSYITTKKMQIMK